MAKVDHIIWFSFIVEHFDPDSRTGLAVVGNNEEGKDKSSHQESHKGSSQPSQLLLSGVKPGNKLYL